MSLTLTQLRQGIAQQLQSVPALNVYATDLDIITPPAAVVTVDQSSHTRPFVTWDDTFDATQATWHLIVRLYISAASTAAGEQQLDPFLATDGGQSIYAALSRDPTLGGLEVNTLCQQARAYGIFDIGGAKYIGCEWEVQVLAS